MNESIEYFLNEKSNEISASIVKDEKYKKLFFKLNKYEGDLTEIIKLIPDRKTRKHAYFLLDRLAYYGVEHEAIISKESYKQGLVDGKRFVEISELFRGKKKGSVNYESI